MQRLKGCYGGGFVGRCTKATDEASRGATAVARLLDLSLMDGGQSGQDR